MTDESLFLASEVQIRDYLKSIERILEIFKAFLPRKKKIIDDIKNKVSKIIAYEKPRGFKAFGKRRAIEKQQDYLFKDANKSLNELVSILSRELKLLPEQLSLDEKEDSLISGIKDIKLFQRLNGQEKNLLTSLIYKDKYYVKQLYDCFQKLVVQIQAQLNQTNNYIKKLKDHFDQGMKDHNLVFLRIDFFFEESELRLSFDYIKHLREHSEWILSEYKKVKEYFDFAEKYFEPAEIDRIKNEIEDEVHKEKQKLNFVQEFFRKQRELRQTLPVSKLIAVHMTNFFPENGKIVTRGQVVTQYLGESVFFPRETIHFSFNGPVSGHGQGNWDDMKYCILIPVPLIFDRFINISPQDAFVFGELKLPKDSEIIGRENDLYGKNPGDAQKIVIPESIDVYEYSKQRIVHKGYILMRVGQWSWNNPAHQNDAKGLSEFFKMNENEVESSHFWSMNFQELANKFDKELEAHGSTFFHQAEDVAHWLITFLQKCRSEKPSKQDVAAKIKLVDGLLPKLKDQASKFHSKEEKEAFNRMKTFFESFKKILVGVEKKCGLKIPKNVLLSLQRK